MTEKTTATALDAAHPLVKKVLDSKPPIAKLIGFDVESIGKRAVGLVIASRPAGESDGYSSWRRAV
jgi:hypothetical protein